ncbi:MAG TPA: DUF1573 domain-containing protein [Bacteroidales bacterium]|nr:DUF1573 domain-containing protein [Bacteroidales bacterium]HPT01073.1 DUF1573 domain-containing protein [Bacteroidales bacterium]
MKKVVLSLAVSMLVSVAVFAQQNATISSASKPAANPNAPVITFEKTTHDYGTVTKGGDGTCEFKFTNTGVEPLILSNCTASCGCTVPDWPREPILKGKSSVVKVKYDTNRIGGINKTINVVSNANNSPVQLRIIGNVVDKSAATAYPEKNLNQGAAPVAK